MGLRLEEIAKRIKLGQIAIVGRERKKVEDNYFALREDIFAKENLEEVKREADRRYEEMKKKQVKVDFIILDKNQNRLYSAAEEANKKIGILK